MYFCHCGENNQTFKHLQVLKEISDHRTSPDLN